MKNNEISYSDVMPVLYQTVLAIIFTFASNLSSAEWSQVGIANNTDVYADLSTLKKSGNLVRIWILHDNETMQPFGNGLNFSSIKHYDEFDCKKDEVKTLLNSFYSDRMGKGTVISNSDRALSLIITPGSVTSTIFKIVCLTDIAEMVTHSNEWLHYKSDSSDHFYFDSATIQRNGSKVSIMQLYNPTKGFPLWMALTKSKRTDIDKTVQSISSRKEYDCMKERVRTIYQILHSDSMAAGNILSIQVENGNEWQQITSGNTEDSFLFNVLCD